MRVDVAAVAEAIARVIGCVQQPAALHEPCFAGREWDYVRQCLDSGWVSSVGRFVDAFEARLADVCGAKYAIATVNGTAALHTALRMAGVERDDEVLVPALTFAATANAVTYCGAVPHFVDAEERTLGIDPHKLARYLERVARRSDRGPVNRATGRTLRAVVPVHVFGHPVDMDTLNAVCREFGLTVVEDATESLGSRYRGHPCGSLGRVGVLSFNGNKIVTSGGGGALVTDDADLARRAKHVTSTAKLAHPWAVVHDQVGWNYRLPNLNAALGLAQLEQLDRFLAAKRRLARRYAEAFAKLPDVVFVHEPAGATSNYWLNAILLADDSAATRDAVLEATHAKGILTRPAWTLMHRLAPFCDCPRSDLGVAESIERRLVSLPSSVGLAIAA
jgi:perosamine synthetase